MNELLKQHIERHLKSKFSKKKKKIEIISATVEPVKVVKVIEISDDDGEIQSETMVEEEEEESVLSESSGVESDDEKDRDFLVRSNGRSVKKLTPVKIKVASPATSESSEKFTCAYCEQTFKAKQGLTRHVQSHIINSIPWKCDANDCEFATSSKIKLNLHKLETHNIPLPLTKLSFDVAENNKQPEEVMPTVDVSEFSCFCGASFSTISSLRAHKK